jgi:hypothetical protein
MKHGTVRITEMPRYQIWSNSVVLLTNIYLKYHWRTYALWHKNEIRPHLKINHACLLTHTSNTTYHSQSVSYLTGIAQRYSSRLRAGWSRVLVPAGAGNFSLHHRVRTGSGTHPASNPNGTRGPFFWIKAAGALTPSSAEVKNVWSYTSTPVIRLHGVMLS